MYSTSIYSTSVYVNLHQSASICTMLQCKSFMLQVAFLEHLEPSPPGHQHLETNTAQQNRSTCFERSHGRRAFHNWWTNVARAVTLSGTSNHCKLFIPCQVFCRLSRCPRTLSLLQKVSSETFEVQTSIHVICEDVQKNLGPVYSWVWPEICLEVTLVIQNAAGPLTPRHAFQILPVSMSPKGQAIAWLLSGVITPLVPMAQFDHTFFAKKIPTGLAAWLRNRSEALKLCGYPYKQLQNAHEATHSITQKDSFFWMKAHKGHTNTKLITNS